MQKLVIATGNAHKLHEIRVLLEPLGIAVLPQSDFNVPEAAEPHCTFIENALAKARHAARLTGLPALADDSGICVEALGGAPGVISAIYAGEPRSDARNNIKLLEAMRDVADRRAHYHCALVLLRHADDPQPIIAEGQWHGVILEAPRGEGGFGYDPLFLDTELNQTVAEISTADKNRVSHRGKALRALVEKLRNIQG
ncbi:MAG: RdgB/HAM1 family non-canonical purine NTP pyrophosphatase [Methylophilaceae bacterium]|uniref:RdgB/HAM1 family non-canonical purine NTP pyrophosphatase n=1 Tax=Methylobacillus sp. MM3 TaxID=1848039 RepID=UPI0007DFDB71|nr:RdgB/HAM1 family non-canonical purine NTP pyrophosphatase [Methylobacillus sp. MM3]OAJ70470.1 non-canonical purine NTP pyrophosphatase, RdgB/HAM1 family [Methylobacillus sp. MM3]